MACRGVATTISERKTLNSSYFVEQMLPLLLYITAHVSDQFPHTCTQAHTHPQLLYSYRYS
eukprot:138007-Prymnesium_polylepis.1